MAKKKKRSGGGRRRRSRVSGTVTSNAVTAIAVAAGTLGGQFLASELAKRDVDQKISAAVQVVGGVMLAAKAKGLVAAAGIGVAASGILSAARGFGVLSGIGAPMVTFSPRAIPPPISQISGNGGYNVPRGLGTVPPMSIISGTGLS